MTRLENKKKVSAEILELSLKSGEALASPASPLPTALDEDTSTVP